MKTKQELIQIRSDKNKKGKAYRPIFCPLYGRTKFIEMHKKFNKECGYDIAYGYRIPWRKIIIKDCACGYWEKDVGCWYRKDFDIRSVAIFCSYTIEGAKDLYERGY